MRHIVFILCLSFGVVTAWLAQPYVHDNSDAKTTIVTVLTVLAGFMIAIITVLGDPASIPEGSWRTVEVRRDNIENKIIRHAWLFVWYLASIAFLFIGMIVSKIPRNDVWQPLQDNWELIQKIIDWIYITTGVTSFMLSFTLPFSLRKIQMERLRIEAERRKREAAQAEKKVVT
jgi:NhaP-type Na+/H+ or K+/H+ antiporter